MSSVVDNNADDHVLAGEKKNIFATVIKGKYCKEAEIAIIAAVEAGSLALQGIKRAKALNVNNNNDSLGVSSKGGIDLVTKYDKGCETLIFNKLREHFPNYEFIGEESSSDNDLSDRHTFCVDPIDGTTNFVHTLPMFAISIGLVVNKKSVLGIIYIPSSGALYQAAEREGAFLNGVRIHVDDSDNLSSALIATNFGHSRDPTVVQSQITSVHNLLKNQARSIRMLGKF
jgi:fructose-1,6-bisphosphatase/inositol monophosphatase family enzyme